MESLGETFNRLKILERISAADTDDTSSIDEIDAPPACPRCRDAGFLRPDVYPGDPAFGTLIPCSCRATTGRIERVEHLRRLSQIGPLARFTFKQIESDPSSPLLNAFGQATTPVERARVFSTAASGWFVILGPSGSGKTMLAAAIANDRIERAEPALFVVVPDLLDHLRATYSPQSDVTYDEVFESVRSAPFLILDDLGSESGTSWADEKLFQIINHRYNAELPTVITSSVVPTLMDDRIHSRVCNPALAEVCVVKDWPDDAAARFGVLPSRLREMTFAAFDPRGASNRPEHVDNLQRALGLVKPFAENPHDWIVLIGEPGCGKTHLAAAIANVQADKGNPFCFVVVPDLLDHLRSSFAPDSGVRYDQMFEDVRNSPLLIMDDLGSQSSTPWAQEKLFQIINHRYNASLPTVITTNVPLEHHERRICSRMLDGRLCTAFGITAPPYRLGGSVPEPPPRTKRSR